MEDNDKIIQLAREKFLKEGFYRISMDELSRELSMSKKTIYKYFPSKEKLVEAVAYSIMNDVKQKITDTVESEESAIVKISRIVGIIGSISLALGDRWMTDIKLHMPELWITVDNFRTGQMNENISRIFEQGKKEGIFEDRPMDILMPLFIAAVRGVVNPDFLLHHNYSFREVVGHVFQILLKGNLTDKGRELFNNTKNGTN